MIDVIPDNILDNLYPLPNPGSIIDVQLLDNGNILALFSHWITLLTQSGRMLSSINIQQKSISLGQFADAFVITCDPKCLYFVEIVDDELYISCRVDTEVQFTGACSLDNDSFVCVAEEEPIMYEFNGRGTCVRTIHMDSYGLDLPNRTSSRRIRQNSIGNVFVSDYKNDKVSILSENLAFIACYRLNFPSNIAACDKYVYVSQDGNQGCISSIDLNEHFTEAIIEGEEDGIVKPNCVSVNRNVIMIGMQLNIPVARKYDVPFGMV